MRRWALLGVTLLLAASIAVARAEDHPTFDSLWQDANSKPSHRTVDEGRDIRVEVPSEQTVYFFTKPGQPEHPGVVKRLIV